MDTSLAMITRFSLLFRFETMGEARLRLEQSFMNPLDFVMGTHEIKSMVQNQQQPTKGGRYRTRTRANPEAILDVCCSVASLHPPCVIDPGDVGRGLSLGKKSGHVTRKYKEVGSQSTDRPLRTPRGHLATPTWERGQTGPQLGEPPSLPSGHVS
uniref:Uncharacterized protein n=1 Tax=Molossus molossus TaxID=27622 RepID=A0A7J8JXB0_MOLMO|nr:hypothetical protein HJG59_008090 [Molossus molossus]